MMAWGALTVRVIRSADRSTAYPDEVAISNNSVRRIEPYPADGSDTTRAWLLLRGEADHRD
jgi:hypothetical protein